MDEPQPVPSSVATSTPSNMASLDENVRRYLQLLHNKQRLLNEVYTVQAELSALKEPLMERFLVGEKSIQICPSLEEEDLYGGIGSLHLKVKNEYESLTRDAIIRLLTEFYTYLLPAGSSPQELARLGQGTALWIWNNRKRTAIRYLDRVYAVKPPPRRPPTKRKPGAAADAIHDGSNSTSAVLPRAARFKPDEHTPHSRDDFLTVPGMATLLSTPLPAATSIADDPSAEDLSADELVAMGPD